MVLILIYVVNPVRVIREFTEKDLTTYGKFDITENDIKILRKLEGAKW